MDTRSVIESEEVGTSQSEHYFQGNQDDNQVHGHRGHSKDQADNQDEEAAPFISGLARQEEKESSAPPRGDSSRPREITDNSRYNGSQGAHRVWESVGTFAKEVGFLTWIGIVFLLLISLRIVMIHPVNIGPFMLVASMPILILGITYRKWLRPKISIHTQVIRAVDIQMVRMFFAGAIPGTMLAMIAESIISVSLVILFFYDQIQKIMAATQEGKDDKKQNGSKDKNDIEVGLAVILFLLLTAYIVAGLTEEAVKLIVLRYKCCGRRDVSPTETTAASSRNTPAESTVPQSNEEAQNSRAHASPIPESMNFYTTSLQDREGGICAQPKPYHPYATVALLMAVAAGFATMENIFYVFPIDTNGGASTKGKATPHVPGFSDKMFNSVGRAFISLPIHIICATLTALRVGERDRQMAEAEQHPERANTSKPLSYPVALMPAVLLHGTFDAVLMILAAVQYDNLVVMIAFPVFMIGCGIGLVYFYWKKSKALYNANVDYHLYHSRNPFQANAENGMDSPHEREVEMRTYS